MVNTIQMTQTGYDELAKELEELKTTKRSEIAEKIKIARGYGDLSENSEYDAAKNEQAEIEARIAVLEEQLKHVTIVDTDSLSLDVVGVGSKVKVLDKDMEEEGEYLIVGAMEVGHEMNTISDQSPVGHALLAIKRVRPWWWKPPAAPSRWSFWTSASNLPAKRQKSAELFCFFICPAGHLMVE